MQSSVAVVALLTYLLPGGSALQEAFTPTRAPPPPRLAVATTSLAGRVFEGPLPRRVILAAYGKYHDQESPGNCVDFFLSVNNLFQHLVEPLVSSGVFGGVYFHTWKARGCPDKDKALVDKLTPLRYHFEEALQATPYHTASSAMKVLELVREAEATNEGTAVVLLRFNVQYSVPINELDIKWEAVNLAFRESTENWERCHMASDLLHIFPVGKTDAVSAAWQKSAQKSSQHCSDSIGTGHYVYDPLKEQLGEAMMHFISPGFDGSSEQVLPQSWVAKGSGMAPLPTSSFLGIQRACRPRQHTCSTSLNLEDRENDCRVGEAWQEPKVPTRVPTRAPRRVVIGFHGHYHRTSDSVMRGNDKCSDFFLSERNIRSNVIDALRNDGAEVAVYFHTVRAPSCADKDQALVEALQPKGYAFDKETLPLISDSYIKVMKLIMDNEPPSNSTAVILLRFDVQYRVPLLSLNIKWEAMNFAFRDLRNKWEGCHMASDLLFVFPLRTLPDVRDAMEWSAQELRPGCFDDKGSGHFVYDPLVRKLGKAKLNFVSPDCASSDVPPLWDQTPDTRAFLGIERTCRQPQHYCSTTRYLEPVLLPPFDPVLPGKLF